MQLALFHTEGSNCIKADIYSTAGYDVLLNLICFKEIQQSITVPSNLFEQGIAHVVFNFLSFPIEKYSINAIENNVTVTSEIQVIPCMEKDSKYLTDDLTKTTNVEDTTVEVDMSQEEVERGEVFVLDFSDKKLITIGNGDLLYSGGGNRYLPTTDGLLIKQTEESGSINDKYSPNILGTIWKIEPSATNYFSGWDYNSDLITEASTTVQKGLTATTLAQAAKFNSIMWVDTKSTEELVNGNYCFSILIKANRLCSAELGTVEYVSGNRIFTKLKDVSISTDYSMIYVEGEFTNPTFGIQVKCTDQTKLFTFMPQIENGHTPTSRILSGLSRVQDSLSCSVYGLNNIPEYGGYVEVGFTSERDSSNNNCLIDWRNSSGEGVFIYQEQDTNSIVAVVGDVTVRSESIELKEGDEFTVKVDWDDEGVTLTVNETQYDITSTPFSSEWELPSSVLIGRTETEGYDFLCGDINSVRFGQ